MNPRRVTLLCFSIFVIYICSPFLTAIVLGTLLAILFHPTYLWLKRWELGRGLRSLIVTFIVTVGVLLPFVFFLYKSVLVSAEQIRPMFHWQNLSTGSEKIENWLAQLNSVIPFGWTIDVDSLREFLSVVGIKLAEFIRIAVSSLPGFLVQLIVMVLAFYFLMIDGPMVLQFVEGGIEKIQLLNRKQIDAFWIRSVNVCRSVVLAAVLSAVIQSIVFWILLLILRIPSSSSWTSWFFLSSFLPLVGSLPISIGLGIYQAIQGNIAIAVVLFSMGLLLNILDSILRPVMMKGSSNLHPMIGFVSAFGGLQTLGIIGIFLGPIIVGMFIALVDIYRHPQRYSQS